MTMDKKIKKIVKSELKQENEISHKYVATNQLLTQGTLYALNLTGNIGAGTSESTRRGDKLKILSLNLKLYLLGVVTTTAYVRISIVNNNSNDYTNSDAVQTGVTTTNFFKTYTFPYIQCKPELKGSYGNRFIYDRVFELEVDNSVNQSSKFVSITKNVNRVIEHIRGSFNQAHGGHYYLVMSATHANATATGDPVKIYIDSEVKFVDPN